MRFCIDIRNWIVYCPIPYLCINLYTESFLKGRDN